MLNCSSANKKFWFVEFPCQAWSGFEGGIGGEVACRNWKEVGEEEEEEEEASIAEVASVAVG